jgi:hypothetical protein
MNVWIRTIQTMVFLGLIVGSAPKLWAGDVTFHGSQCKALGQENSYNRLGIQGLSTRALTPASCGAFFSAGSVVSSVQVVVYDRNIRFDVPCTVQLTDAAGNSIWSQTKTTSGTADVSSTLTFTPGLSSMSLYVTCVLPPIDSPGISSLASYRVVTQ